MSHASLLRAVRAHFQLSQAELAVWLGLSRALLASVETGREQLPRHARPWLRPWRAALLAAVPDDEQTAPEPLLPLPFAGPAAVLARVAACEQQAGHLGQQQARLLACHRAAHRRLEAGPLLLAALPLPHPAEPTALARRRRWLARLLEAAADALAPAAPDGPVAAALLDARHRASRHEAALLRAYLQGQAPE